MTASISLDLHKRILKACDGGEGTQSVAQRFDVSPSFLRKLKQRRRETERIEALPWRSGSRPKLKASAERLRRLIDAQPDATLVEHRE
jgi:transposase